MVALWCGGMLVRWCGVEWWLICAGMVGVVWCGVVAWCLGGVLCCDGLVVGVWWHGLVGKGLV